VSTIPRHLKIGLVLIVIAGVVSYGYFENVVGRIQSMVREPEKEAANPFVASTEPLFSSEDPPLAVKVFFPPVSGSSILSSEQRTIFKSSELTNRAKQLLKLIIDGPLSKELLGAIPKDAKLQEVFVSKDGVLFVDFSSAISVNHPGGMVNEQATIYAIVDSLLYNLPEIHQVKILIGGTEQETLAGHCLLLLPLEMDLSITGEEQGAHAN
jgi:hypothetical protein